MTKALKKIRYIAFFTILFALLMSVPMAFADDTAAPQVNTITVEADKSSIEQATDASDSLIDAACADEDSQAGLAAAPRINEEPASDQDAADPTQTASSPVDEPLIAMAASDTVEMHRLYNPNSGEHFYTASNAERGDLVYKGWKYEGVGWVAPIKSNTPVYRLYNPNAGDHHYTMNVAERNHLVAVGWNDEGIGWYSDDARSVSIYRQYNPNAKTGTHNYTYNKSENDNLKSLGWKEEGVGWYAVEEGAPAKESYIYLDAGHGIGSSTKGVYDPGAKGNGYEEAKLTAELVTLTAKYAKELYGIKVYTNVDDNIEYWNRQTDAQERGCTSLVSIHFNSYDGGATGVESFIHSKNAAAGASQLQSIMHEHLVEAMGLRDRGKKEAALSVCSGIKTGLPGTLLEICFIDNSYDMEQYMKKKDSVARALAAGLAEAAKKGF